MASIPACHAGDRSSILRDGVFFALSDQRFIFYKPQMCSLVSYLPPTQTVRIKTDKKSLFGNLKVDPSSKPFRHLPAVQGSPVMNIRHKKHIHPSFDS